MSDRSSNLCAKNKIQEIIDSLPDDADVDIDAFLDRIDLLERLDEAEQQFAAGLEISHEAVEQEFKEWLK